MQDKQPLVIDFSISIGSACRPAHHLRRTGLSVCSNPLDWMMSYKLSDVVRLFQTNFSDFFKEASEDKKRKLKCRAVTDLKTGMISLHSFPHTVGIEAYYPHFFRIMHGRYERMVRYIQKSETILFLADRKSSEEDVYNFLHEIYALYPKKYILINIKNNPLQMNLLRRQVEFTENLTFVEYEVNDTHPNGASSEVNPDFWQGNAAAWTEILSSIRLSGRLSVANTYKEDSTQR